MKVLDCFAGIGGFSLGLERAGFETVAFCEIEPYCQKVLAKHWPEVPIYDDIREITADRLIRDGVDVDVITAGWPCQDVSTQGKKIGLAGSRTGLWSECARLIGEIRPSYAIFENVTNLLHSNRGAGFQQILCDLTALRYDAEWQCIPASAFGAHHHRDRVWILAYPERVRQQRSGKPEDPGYLQAYQETQTSDAQYVRFGKFWEVEPGLDRVADGIPYRLERLTAIGNAIVPQIAEFIGEAIKEAERGY